MRTVIAAVVLILVCTSCSPSGQARSVTSGSTTTSTPLRVADEPEHVRIGQPVVAIAVGPAGFVAVGADEGLSSINEDNTAVIWVSPDGLSWSQIESDPTFRDAGMSDVAWYQTGEVFVAVGHSVSRGAIWVSPDGSSWTRVALLEFASPGGGIEVDSITTVGSGLLAMGREWLGEGEWIPASWISVDGRSWNRTDVDLPTLQPEDS